MSNARAPQLSRHDDTASGLPRAVLWDLDGTLMDTEPLWQAQEAALVAEYGGIWTDDDAVSLVGLPLLDSADRLRARTPVTLAPELIVERLQHGVVAALRTGVPWRPGALELLHELRALHVPQALVTMSWQPVLEVVLGPLPAETFTAVVTGDAVTHGKPHPEPYLTALARLDLATRGAECVAIEDSSTGAASAVAAGIPTLVTPCVKPVDPAPGLVVLPSLAGLRAADLRAAAGPARSELLVVTR